MAEQTRSSVCAVSSRVYGRTNTLFCLCCLE